MSRLKVSRKRKNLSENTTIDIFIKVQIFAVLIYLLFFLLFSMISLFADISMKYDYMFSILCFALGSFTSGFYVGYKLKQNGLLAGIIYTAPINTLIILVSMLFSDFSVDYTMIITVVILVASAALGGVVSVNRRRKR